jgi:hypothetical protein
MEKEAGMSKAETLAGKVATEGITSRKDAIAIAESIRMGGRTMTRIDATAKFGEAADLLDVSFARLNHNLRALAEAEKMTCEESRRLISTSKDIAGKIGDAMARIDKVVVKDFETKLAQLERFVAAMQALDQLKRAGTLDALVGAISK